MALTTIDDSCYCGREGRTGPRADSDGGRPTVEISEYRYYWRSEMSYATGNQHSRNCQLKFDCRNMFTYTDLVGSALWPDSKPTHNKHLLILIAPKYVRSVK